MASRPRGRPKVSPGARGERQRRRTRADTEPATPTFAILQRARVCGAAYASAPRRAQPLQGSVDGRPRVDCLRGHAQRFNPITLEEVYAATHVLSCSHFLGGVLC